MHPGVVPALRYQHTADSWGSVMVVFGGTASDGLLLNDVWTYHSLQGIDSWTPLTPVGTSQPPGTCCLELYRWQTCTRCSTCVGVTGHCSAVIQSTLYVYGGLTSVDMSYDLWAFGLTNNEWTLFPRSISVSSGKPSCLLLLE